MIQGLCHVAVAVPHLDAAISLYRDGLGAKVSAPQDHPRQGVTIAFVDLGSTRIELMQPLGENSPIARFLETHPQGGLHHICLEATDLEAATAAFSAHGGRVLAAGQGESVGAQGRPVAFLHPKDCCGTLIELEQA